MPTTWQGLRGGLLSGGTLHAAIDLLAAMASLAVTAVCARWRLGDAAGRVESIGWIYALVLTLGAVVGGFAVGTLNLWLSGVPEVGRSVVGALAGAIVAIEWFKRARGIRRSTGLIFVPAFAISVAIGRWGCFLSGIGDHTHGIATRLPWGHDFGDGVLRHPVQLYESFSMTAFLIAALALVGVRNKFFMNNGFYALVMFYAAQRFCWEFLKPYGAVIGPFNLFHLICAGLLGYGVVMVKGGDGERTDP